MLNQRLSAAKKVATSLFHAEDEIDSAVASTAGLIVTILAARSEAKLPAVIGQDALDALGAAVGSLLQSRRQVVEAHKGLDVARGQIGLDVVSWGDQFPKPAVGAAGEPAVATLRAVS